MKYLFWMELRRSLLQMRRYPIETMLSFLILSGMFFGIALGASVAFFLIGLALFGRMRLRAMRRATIGHY